MRNTHWPTWNERRWSDERLGYRRGGWHRPRPRRWQTRRRPEEHYAAVIGVLALVGAFTLGGIFLLLVSQITQR